MKEERINEYELTFSTALKQYLTMGLSIWSSLQLALTNIDNAGHPPAHSPIPKRNYKSMTEQQFVETVVDDLHSYIMGHDVTAGHLSDYLSDILQILNTEEQDCRAVESMGQSLMSLIVQMQESNYHRLLELKNNYDFLKSVAMHHQGQSVSSEDEDQEKESEGEDDQMQQSIHSEQQKDMMQDQKEEQVPRLTQAEAAELSDGGWVVVTKNNKNNNKKNNNKK